MVDRLKAERSSPPEHRRTRLVFLAIALTVYPAAYTLVGLYPNSAMASHIQPDPRIPQAITWREAPGTWWRLVVELTWMAFTAPQRDFTPAVGEKADVDEQCKNTGFIKICVPLG